MTLIHKTLPDYVYEPLPTPTSVRMITNLKYRDPPPGKQEGITDPTELLPYIEFSLTVVDLNDTPQYDCISYTWGCPIRVFPNKKSCESLMAHYLQTRPVLCDGKVLFVGMNLYDLLLRLIQFGEHSQTQGGDFKYIKAEGTWADAICINQRDLEERGRQVAIMGRIYSDAQSVLAWLGEQDWFSKPGINALMTLSILPRNLIDEAKLVNPIHANLTAFGFPSNTPVFDIYAVLQRAWFRRGWILQEAVLARKISFICGSLHFSFAVLTGAADFLYRSGWWAMSAEDIVRYQETGITNELIWRFTGRRPLGVTTTREERMWEIGHEKFHDPCYIVCEILDSRVRMGRFDSSGGSVQAPPEVIPPSYREIITRYRLLDTQDARDKIFAFLGLRPTTAIPKLLTPNYVNTRADQVYHSAAWYLISEGRNLDIFSEVENVKIRKHTSLPSWVPDLSVMAPGTRLGTAHFCPFAASGTHKLELEPGDHLSDDPPQILSLKGYRVDSVAEVATKLGPNTLSSLGFLRNLPPYYGSQELAATPGPFLLWPKAATTLSEPVPVPKRVATEESELESSRQEVVQGADAHNNGSHQEGEPMAEAPNVGPQAPTADVEQQQSSNAEDTEFSEENPKEVNIDPEPEKLEQSGPEIAYGDDGSSDSSDLETFFPQRIPARRHSDPALPVSKPATNSVPMEPAADVGDTPPDTRDPTDPRERSLSFDASDLQELRRISEVAAATGGLYPQHRDEDSMAIISISEFRTQDPSYMSLPLRAAGDYVAPRPVQTRIEAYWRTFLADCIGNKHPAPLEYGFAFGHAIRKEASQRRILALTEILRGHVSGEVDDDGDEAGVSEHERFQTLLQDLYNLIIDEPGPFVEQPLLERMQEDANKVIEEFHEHLFQRHLADTRSYNQISELQEIADHNQTSPFAVDVTLGPVRFLPELDDMLERDADVNSPAYRVLPEFLGRVSQISGDRRLFTTVGHHYLGMGPEAIVSGDQLWVLAGGKVPYVLRPKGNGNYQLLGEAYVHGIMHGEAVERDGIQFETLLLE